MCLIKYRYLSDFEVAQEFVQIKLEQLSYLQSRNGQYQQTFEALLNWCVNCMAFDLTHDLDYINHVTFNKSDLTITFT